MNPKALVTKGKIASLKGRLVSVTKAADLLAVAEELKALGSELAREESAASGAGSKTPGKFVWPQDLNEVSTATKEWGKDGLDDEAEEPAEGDDVDG